MRAVSSPSKRAPCFEPLMSTFSRRTSRSASGRDEFLSY
jgi:hypothetical protein